MCVDVSTVNHSKLINFIVFFCYLSVSLGCSASSNHASSGPTFAIVSCYYLNVCHLFLRPSPAPMSLMLVFGQVKVKESSLVPVCYLIYTLANPEFELLTLGQWLALCAMWPNVRMVRMQTTTSLHLWQRGKSPFINVFMSQYLFQALSIRRSISKVLARVHIFVNHYPIFSITDNFFKY